MGVDDVGSGLLDEGADGGGDGAVEEAAGGDGVGLDAFAAGGLVELEIGLGVVGEDAEDAAVARGVEGAREVEDDRLRAVHAAAADDVEDDHEGPSGSGVLRLRMAQSAA